MPIGLDHTILEVHDLTESLSFYRDVVGLEHKGKDGPFEGLLITPDLALELYDGWPVEGSRHLASRWTEPPSMSPHPLITGNPHRART